MVPRGDLEETSTRNNPESMSTSKWTLAMTILVTSCPTFRDRDPNKSAFWVDNWIQHREELVACIGGFTFECNNDFDLVPRDSVLMLRG